MASSSSSSLLLLFSPRPRTLDRHSSRRRRRRLILGPALMTPLPLAGVPGGPSPAPLLLPPARSSNDGGDHNPSPAADRILSAACYLYPFLDGVQYGRYLLAQFPVLQLPLRPLLPFISLFRSFPLNSFLLFLALYFAVVRNPSAFTRYVRFNTMQAIALDVLLIFPDLVERSSGAVREGVGLDLLMSLDSTVFLYLAVCLLYGSGSCLLGRLPRLPLVAEAAERQVM